MKPRIPVLLIGLMLACDAPSILGQADDLQPSVHEKVGYYIYNDPKGEKWEAEKKALADYSQEQLVHALITEIDIDRGTTLSNKGRDVAAFKLFHALGLPPTLVCQELDKQQPPQRKAALVFILRDVKSPEVTQALLHQLGDRRPAVNPMGFTEIAKPRAFRVCDVAFNALADILGAKTSQRVSVFISNTRRDEIIQETLAELKLASP